MLFAPGQENGFACARSPLRTQSASSPVKSKCLSKQISWLNGFGLKLGLEKLAADRIIFANLFSILFRWTARSASKQILRRMDTVEVFVEIGTRLPQSFAFTRFSTLHTGYRSRASCIFEDGKKSRCPVADLQTFLWFSF